MKLLNILREVQSESNPFTGTKVPDVLYHGTNQQFKKFEMKGERGGRHYGDGFYFTDNIQYAKEFGDIILQCYINVTNPFDMYDVDEIGYKNLMKVMRSNAQTKEQKIIYRRAKNEYSMGYYHSVYKRAIQGKLTTAKEIGYDSLIMVADHDTGGKEYMVYSPNQIQIIGMV